MRRSRTPRIASLAVIVVTIRGAGNITNFRLFGLITIFDADGSIPGLFLDPGIWAVGSTGTEDPPNWWNLGHRPAKFFDAGMSSDATRIELSWYMPGAALPNFQKGYDAILDNEYASNTWMLGLESPAYPLPVNTTRAEQGAVMFHTLDPWASSRTRSLRGGGIVGYPAAVGFEYPSSTRLAAPSGPQTVGGIRG